MSVDFDWESFKSHIAGVGKLTLSFVIEFQFELIGLALLALSLLTLVSLAVPAAFLTGWKAFTTRLFGWGVYPAAGLIGALGVLLLFQRTFDRFPISGLQALGIELLFFAGLGIAHLVLPAAEALLRAEAGQGGGYIGWGISQLLRNLVGAGGAAVLLILLAAVSALLVLQVEREQLARAARFLRRQCRILLERIQPEQEVLSSSRAPHAPADISPLPEEPAVPPAKARPSKAVEKPKKEKKAALVPQPAAATRDDVLPPMDLLRPEGNKIVDAEGDAQLKAEIIVETLASFGVPARVVDINRGPTVTQFGIEPGYLRRRTPDGREVLRKVRVSKIHALANDLALALSAAPIRIEAPVPGRPYVGIEVPNTKTALVSLRGVMESDAFRSIDSPLAIALGRDVSGAPVAADLAAMPHLLIAGATGSGKSICINAIVTCLLMENTPETLRLLLIDPKRVELAEFNGVPHLIAPVVVDLEQVVGALHWVTREMDERYRRFSDIGARHLMDYNQRMVRRGEAPLPYLVVIIDELADLMMIAPDQVEQSLCRIAQMARATGIHLVIATQRPSVDVVTGLIKANFPARISFAVTSQVDSRVILDCAGAEKLLGRGDMLFMAPDASKLRRIQGCFVSDKEIRGVVRFWRKTYQVAEPAMAPADLLPEETSDEEGPVYPWEEEEFMLEDEGDPLFDEAVALLAGKKSISTSYLQRALRVGYPRAARLMDLLEENGYVGPNLGGGRSREVLSSPED